MINAIFIFKSKPKTSTIAKFATAVKNNNIPACVSDNFARIEDEKLKDVLCDYIAKYANKSSKKNKARIIQVDDILRKLALCNDNKAVSASKDILLNANDCINSKTLQKVECILDSVNTLNDKYCNLFRHNYINTNGFVHNIYKKLFGKTLKEHFIKKISSGINVNLPEYSHYKSFFERGFSENRKNALFDIYENISKTFKANKNVQYNNIKKKFNKKNINAENRLNSLRELIIAYPAEKNLAYDFWANYFLSKQDKQTQFILKKIYNEFGSIVCFNEKQPFSKLVYLYDELNIWKKASSGKAKFPALIDLRVDNHILNNKTELRKTIAYCIQSQSKIVISPESIIHKSGNKAIRHELAHFNDPFMRSVKICDSPSARQEMLRAGIDKDHIDYAFVDLDEKKAVFSEGIMKKYSDHYKKDMIDAGLPDWIVNLEELSPDKYRLFAYHKSIKDYSIISELDNLLGGYIPKSVVDLIIGPGRISKPQYICKKNKVIRQHSVSSIPLKIVHNICKQNRGKILSPTEFLNLYNNKLSLYKHNYKSHIRQKYPDIDIEYNKLMESISQNPFGFHNLIFDFKKKYSVFV